MYTCTCLNEVIDSTKKRKEDALLQCWTSRINLKKQGFKKEKFKIRVVYSSKILFTIKTKRLFTIFSVSWTCLLWGT